MGYRMMGRGHAALMLWRARLAGEAGQGTVEYVALILLVAAIMAAVVAATTNKAEGNAIAKKVTDELKSAIDSDSSFADAYAGLAQTYNSYAIGNYSDNKPEKYFIEARTLAQRALALDSTVAEAHSAMANVSMFYDFDWAAAERSFKKSLALDARSANSRAFRLALYEFIGQFREAVAEGREDVWLQPRSEQPKLELRA